MRGGEGGCSLFVLQVPGGLVEARRHHTYMYTPISLQVSYLARSAPLFANIGQKISPKSCEPIVGTIVYGGSEKPTRQDTMVYGEFRARVRGLGRWSLVEVSEEFGIGVSSLYQWKAHGVPRYAEYWLRWRECEGRHKRGEAFRVMVREYLDGQD